jgi:hypothetical protein
MSHYAKIENGIVTKIIVAEQGFFDTFVDETPGEWIKTYKGMWAGILYDGDSGEGVPDTSGTQRKNFAGIGGSFDVSRDAFIPPKHYASWVIDEDTCNWLAPFANPDGKLVTSDDYDWDEEAHQLDNTTGWVVK